MAVPDLDAARIYHDTVHVVKQPVYESLSAQHVQSNETGGFVLSQPYLSISRGTGLEQETNAGIEPA